MNRLKHPSSQTLSNRVDETKQPSNETAGTGAAAGPFAFLHFTSSSLTLPGVCVCWGYLEIMTGNGDVKASSWLAGWLARGQQVLLLALAACTTVHHPTIHTTTARLTTC